MTVKPGHVGIAGGSISGCAAAIAFAKHGWRVSVFERSATTLSERGSGIGMPEYLVQELIDGGYLPADHRTTVMHARDWLYPDGSDGGRLLWTQPTRALANNWGVLWANLRKHVPDDAYHGGLSLTDFRVERDRVAADFSDGRRRDFDLLIGADGYRSLCRGKLQPEARTSFAGYVLWRGNYPEARLNDRSVIAALDSRKAWLTVPFKGGHGVIYMIPDSHPDRRRVNWAIYAQMPEGLALEGVSSIPPGAVPPALLKEFLSHVARSFPPAIATFVTETRPDEVSIQPIFDSEVDAYAAGRVLLVGDAGTMARPHTASGATKALEDVLAIDALLGSADSLDDLLTAYSDARRDAARALLDIGRKIGQAQVMDTPSWQAMTPKDFEDWTAATMAGKTLYLYDVAQEA